MPWIECDDCESKNVQIEELEQELEEVEERLKEAVAEDDARVLALVLEGLGISRHDLDLNRAGLELSPREAIKRLLPYKPLVEWPKLNGPDHLNACEYEVEGNWYCADNCPTRAV